MGSTYRTLLRAFLLLGGLAYVLFGILAGTTLEIGIGLLAATVGGIGLWWEHSAGGYEQARDREADQARDREADQAQDREADQARDREADQAQDREADQARDREADQAQDREADQARDREADRSRDR